MDKEEEKEYILEVFFPTSKREYSLKKQSWDELWNFRKKEKERGFDNFPIDTKWCLLGNNNDVMYLDLQDCFGIRLSIRNKSVSEAFGQYGEDEVN